MIDFVLWLLHTVGKPLDHMGGVITKQLMYMLYPTLRFAGVAIFNIRCPIQVKAPHASVGTQSSLVSNRITNELRFSWGPGHCFNGTMFSNPCGGFDVFDIVLRITDWLPICIFQGDRLDAIINTCGGPKATITCEDEVGLWHVAV